MNRSAYLALTVAAGTLSLGLLVANIGSVAPQAVAQAPSPRPDLLASTKAADVVDVGEAFLATLSDEQRATAQIRTYAATRRSVDKTFRVESNVRVNGVFFRDLKPEQVEAALKVARIALGEEGFARYQEVRAADDALAKGRGGRGPGGPDQKKADGDPARKKADGVLAKKKERRWGMNFQGDELRGRVPGQALEDVALDPCNWATTISPSTSTTRGRPAPRLLSTSPLSRRCGRTIKTRRTNRSPRCAESLHGLLISLTPEQAKQAKLEARFD